MASSDFFMFFSSLDLFVSGVKQSEDEDEHENENERAAWLLLASTSQAA